MSDQAVSLSQPQAPAPPAAAGSFLGHARLIGFLTLISRILGMARESVAANYFGAGAVWAAFTVAFTIPNLFRKLFGEGALSASFIPLYAQALREGSGLEVQDSQAKEPSPSNLNPEPRTLNPLHANDFAAASVNLLAAILVGLTIIGEILLLGSLWIFDLRPDRLLALKLAAIMLPYVLLVCGTAFLGGILQVHRRFGAPAAAPIVLNACLIIAIVSAALLFDLRSERGREMGVYYLAAAVLVAGVLQVAMLLPALRRVGFRFRLMVSLWTPAIRRMVKLSIPVALGAGVLQLSVFLDKGIALLLAQGADHSITHFTLFGHAIRYPMAEGAAARLNWAQYLYQFPLGIFAIALATAIFPRLSDDALDADRQQFRHILRRGIEATMFIGIPASIGLILVRYPAVRVLFERGEFTPADTVLVARSTFFYAAAIWAFSLQLIVLRAYYALHDTFTPLVMAVVTLAVNLCVEIPLIFTPLAEAGMAAGTAVSFSVQAVVMLAMLSRRVGGLGLRSSLGTMLRIVVASTLMLLACLLVQRLPFYSQGEGSWNALLQLLILTVVGGGVYFACCAALGVGILEHLLPKRRATGT